VVEKRILGTSRLYPRLSEFPPQEATEVFAGE
jgi:hypothetical protein